MHKRTRALDPILTAADQPRFPAGGPLEHALLQEVTDSDVWTSFRSVPSLTRVMTEVVCARLAGYQYGVGHSNGTWAITSGLRAQLLERPHGWIHGRTDLLVPVMTCTPAFVGALSAFQTPVSHTVRLVMIDCMRDGTMDPKATRRYLEAHADRVIGLMPTTLYGSYPDMPPFVEMADEYGVLHHHDDAQGGGASLGDVLDGMPRAYTASMSGHGHAKTTPAGEAGMAMTDDPALAARMRALTDCGTPPSEADWIPRHPDHRPLIAGNTRLAEHPAALLLAQTLRAIPQGLVATRNRVHLQARMAEFERPVLWNPPAGVDAPPFYKLHVEATDALEDALGITPAGLRRLLTAWGFIEIEPPFVPAHQQDIWASHATGHYPGAERYYKRGILLHSRYQRDTRFPTWIDTIVERLHDDTDALRTWLRHQPTGSDGPLTHTTRTL